MDVPKSSVPGPAALDLPRTLEEFAARLTLKQPNLDLFREEHQGLYSALAISIVDHLVKQDEREILLLPNLQAFGNRTVAVFSDYAGESSGRYQTYSFLVCAMDGLSYFGERQAEIRARYGLGSAEIAFKSFRMGAMRSALPDYLRNAESTVPGFILTVVIDKRIGSVFHPEGRDGHGDLAKELAAHGYGIWNRKTAEKLLRIVDTAGLLVGLLSHPGQKVFWMTDNDDICANEGLHRHLLSLFQNAVLLYAPHRVALVGGATPFETRSPDFDDLLSLTDVVASSVEHYLSRRDAAKGGEFEVKSGAEHVLQWLAHDGIGIRKSTILLKPGEEGGIVSSTLEFTTDIIPDDVRVVGIPVRRAHKPKISP